MRTNEYYIDAWLYDKAIELGIPMNGLTRLEQVKYEIPLTDAARAIEAVLPSFLKIYLKRLK